MQKTEQPDLKLKELGQFSGTQQYYRVWLGALATDGVKYIMSNGYSFFVTDALSVIKCTAKIRREPFLTVKLKRIPEKNEADLIITDGNKHELHRQHYDFTDAKRDLNLYFIDNVLLLASEY